MRPPSARPEELAGGRSQRISCVATVARSMTSGTRAGPRYQFIRAFRCSRDQRQDPQGILGPQEASRRVGRQADPVSHGCPHTVPGFLIPGIQRSGKAGGDGRDPLRVVADDYPADRPDLLVRLESGEFVLGGGESAGEGRRGAKHPASQGVGQIPDFPLKRRDSRGRVRHRPSGQGGDARSAVRRARDRPIPPRPA